MWILFRRFCISSENRVAPSLTLTSPLPRMNWFSKSKLVANAMFRRLISVFSGVVGSRRLSYGLRSCVCFELGICGLYPFISLVPVDSAVFAPMDWAGAAVSSSELDMSMNDSRISKAPSWRGARGPSCYISSSSYFVNAKPIFLFALL